MSRIQDILAKAERDGTTRRVIAPPSPSASARQVPARHAFDYELMGATMAPAIEEANDLLEEPYAPPARTEAVHAPQPAPAASAAAASAAAAPARAEVAAPRAVRAVLHPALVAAIEPHSKAAEEYRSMRARLSREELGPLRTIMITSPGRREGKSITAANLALTMAHEIQRRVVLVDCDLRGAAVHTLFGIEQGAGLSEVLAGEATLDQALVHLPEHGLVLLTAGAIPRFPTELLGSAAMRRTLDLLRARFDRVLLDTPSMMPLADAGTLAPMTDGALVVLRAGVTRRPALDQALATLDRKQLLGLVLNEAH
jgi:capsular exopolysaccharide synthesis family protein